MGSNGKPPSRWERLLEQKPIPIIDHLVEEVAKLLARELARWPMQLEEVDLRVGRGFEELVAPDAPRPDPRAYEEAFRLARWELEHELDAYDDYMRNRRWMERGLPPDAKPTLLLLSRWLTEQLSALAEATENRVKRKHLVQILDRARGLMAVPAP